MSAVDFKLASTYVPVVFATSKFVLVVASCFFLLERNGLIAVLCMLYLDRTYGNSDFIFDVNYALVGWVLFQFSCVERVRHGYDNPAVYVVHGLWMLALTLNEKVQIPTCIVLFALNSVFVFTPDTWPIFVFRAFLYLLFVILTVYVREYFACRNTTIHAVLFAGVIVSTNIYGAVLFFLVATVSLCVVKVLRSKADIDLEAQALRQALEKVKQQNAKQ